MEAVNLNVEERKFLGYHIGGMGMSIPFCDGYDDVSAIARAINLAQGQGGIILVKGYKTADGVVKEQLYPTEAKKQDKVFGRSTKHKRTIKW